MSKQLGRVILSHVAQPPRTVYVGESPADLSVYAEPGWDAWLTAWGLIGEWDWDMCRGSLTDKEVDERIDDLRAEMETLIEIREHRTKAQKTPCPCGDCQRRFRFGKMRG